MIDAPEGPDHAEAFWDSAARADARWHIATGVPADDDAFAQSGRVETDLFLAHCGIVPAKDRSVLEIGCGIGRMTQRLADLYGDVIGLDVSEEMLEQARRRLAAVPNIVWVHGNGHDLQGIGDASVDAVFSYIVLQHMPTPAGQCQYLREIRRVLRPGGIAGIQIRANTPAARALDWVGHLRHRVQGRRTFDRAWRGSRVPRRQLIAAASGVGDGETGPCASVELRPFGRRHTWVVLRRDF